MFVSKGTAPCAKKTPLRGLVNYLHACRESSNILTAIGAVNIFVEAGIEKGGVLVHCAGGRSRSAAFVVAFIMSTQGCSYDTAYAQVRRARPVASVNRGFEQQLRAYGAAQCDVFAAHQMMLRVRAAALLDRRNLLLLRRSSGGASSDAAGGGGGSGGGAAGAGEQAKLPPPPLAQQQGAIGAVAGAVSTTGIPPTPRSPRGRGRSPAAGNPATYRQRRGSGGATLGGGDGGSAITTGPMAVAPGVSKGREDKTQFLPKEVCAGIHVFGDECEVENEETTDCACRPARFSLLSWKSACILGLTQESK